MATQAKAVVHTEIQDGIGLICLASPPVNALGIEVRRGVHQAIETMATMPEVRVIAIYGDGRNFCAGADIREFGKPLQQPSLVEVCNAIEASSIPVITILHGVAFGGGLELPLASHARIGIPGVRVALPEVSLGLMPGVAGTQRLPRLTGIPAAIDIICSAREVGAEEALSLGILDCLRTGEPRDVALAAAMEVLNGILVTRRTAELTVTPDVEALTKARTRLQSMRPALKAPVLALEAIAGCTLPFAEGCAKERRLFLELLEGPERQGLIHAFFAERASSNIPEASSPPRVVKTIGVIGGGTMGVGIATAHLMAGLPVTLVETEESRVTVSRDAIIKNLTGAVARGKLTDARHAEALQHLICTTDLKTLVDADLVIEAVFEEMSVKKALFAKLDSICKPDAILATNTSYLDVDEIATATTRPRSVIGLHFFAPAHVMRLLEVVVARHTEPGVVSAAFALARKMNKIPVRSGVCDGFIGNRILTRYRKVADYMLLDGASFEQIDNALEEFGFAMGTFAVADLSGLDIGMLNRRRKSTTRPPQERYSRVADLICDRGWYGRKAGQGYYLYNGSAGRAVNPGAVKIVEEERAAAGIVPRTFSDEEIVDRYMMAMIVEAVRVLEEGVALRPIDIDAVKLFGYGFPRHRGGPMNYADQVGAAQIVRRIETYAREDAYTWRVPALLNDMAKDGRSFASLNKS